MFSKGRECAAGGCTTTLSVYNPLPLCFQHDREHQARKIALETRGRSGLGAVLAQPASFLPEVRGGSSPNPSDTPTTV